MTYPTIRILPGRDRRFRGGSPWLFSNELEIDAAAKALLPGSVVRIMTAQAKVMGVAHFNPHSLIAARMLTRNKDAVIDLKFVRRRIARALAVRDRLFDRPFYRLVHAEADGLPGLVIDRLGDTVVLQPNTAGWDRLTDLAVAAVDAELRPRTIVVRGDTPVRALEGLGDAVQVAKGEAAPRIEIEENGLVFVADVMGGQKTGWYFDQRDNRAFVARLARGQRMLDLYSYAGGFALAAAAGGAGSVLGIDRAEAALDLARASAERQGVAGRCEFRRNDVFAAVDELAAAKERFGLVVADPPPFVKAKKDLGAGLRGYAKLARGSAGLVAEGGFLCIACCSHNVPEAQFLEAVFDGIKDAGRGGRLLRAAGAGPDHPTHPALPESAYLKFLAFALD
ncbi:MAG TPA: class I SAM-dependent rRNA methyltransferase [Geminicoccaceae bacterium]|nr:class I SAM-dependent rRNA methyltransferase [Geminicoccus sp.]HMU48599.1 class I SAM-dependent rRNA methyltransferase [Geminicoccaceae bacterium]